jgi:hypothetical protein
MNNLKYFDQALFYHSFGLNIICLGCQINMYNHNDNNLFKAPNHDFKSFKTDRQAKKELLEINWKNSIGIGCILGFENLVAIDIDGCNQISVVENICKILGLHENYEWVIRSGSGNGFHILIKCLDKPFFKNKTVDIGKWNIAKASKEEPVFGSIETNAYYPHIEKRVFTKIEFKWEGNIVLPPSLHLSGNEYAFVNNLPNKSPSIILFNELKMVKEFYGSIQASYSDKYNSDDHKHIIQAIAEKDENSYNFQERRIEPYFIFWINKLKLNDNIETSQVDSMYVIQVNWLVLDKSFNVLKRKSFNYLKKAKKITTTSTFNFDQFKNLITTARTVYLEFIYDLQHASTIIFSNQTQLSFVQREIQRSELYLDGFQTSVTIESEESTYNKVKDKPLVVIDNDIKNSYQNIYELYFDFLRSHNENTTDYEITDVQFKYLFDKFTQKKVKNPQTEDNIDDLDSTIDYGNSYKKYGGYNGWSDDVIDDAFEGNPDLTWNFD